ncbi:MAG: 5-oxoprolinase subunit PxpB [Janthinobacterium lividum]
MPRLPDTAAPVAAAFPLIEPAGDRCLLIRLGDRIEPEVTRRVHALTERLFAALHSEGDVWSAGDAGADSQMSATAGTATGTETSAATNISATTAISTSINTSINTAISASVIDIVPAFTTVALHYRPERLPRAHGSAYAQLHAAIAPLLRDAAPTHATASRLIEIPVCYGGEYGPDLDDVARRCGLTPEEVVRLHGATEVGVHTFFFSPGNPFAGPLDARLSVPRRTTPRTRVEAGSVAIANGLTSIYQVASPGGWNIIGRTPWSLFDLAWSPPTRLRLGDRLRFTPIPPEAFLACDEHRAR